MGVSLPERQAVDTPQEFWFRRPDFEAPIQEVVPVKHAEELVAKGWELISVGPLPEQPAPAPQAESYAPDEPASDGAEE